MGQIKNGVLEAKFEATAQELRVLQDVDRELQSIDTLIEARRRRNHKVVIVAVGLLFIIGVIGSIYDEPDTKTATTEQHER